MWFLWIIGVLAVLALLLSVFLYFFCFYNPPKNRLGRDVSYIDSVGYKKYYDLLEGLLNKLKAAEHEDVEVLAFDGTVLRGRLYVQTPDAPFVLMMHGYRACADRDFSAAFDIVRKLGYNVLLIDERACGLSDGRTVSFGIKEMRDCESWLNYLICRFGDEIRIALMGVSMGAATVMMATNLELPSNVKCIVEDCGYTSPKEIIKFVARSKGVPADLAYPFARFGAMVFGHFDPNSCSAIEGVAKTDIPIFFVHGEVDDFVPYFMCGELYSACSSEKEMLSVPDAGHAQSYGQWPDEYEKRVSAFLRRHL